MNFSLKFFLVLFVSIFLTACNKDEIPDILLLPQEVALDSNQNRLFVADSEANNFSLVQTEKHNIVSEKPLLNADSGIRIPTLPQGMVAVPFEGGLTRLFIIGAGPSPRNRIVALDYDDATGLRFSPFSIIVGSDTLADQADLLGGIAADLEEKTIFVSNSTDSLVRAYSAENGTELSGSPIAVSSLPVGLAFNPIAKRLVVSSMGTNTITLIDTSDLTLAPSPFDVGVPTRSVASATNAQGSALFVLNPLSNEIRVFKIHFGDLSLSSLFGNPILPPGIDQPDSATNPLTGIAQRLVAAPLTDGRLAAFFTQSTGDLGFIELSPDLTAITTGRSSSLSGLDAIGIDLFKDSAGNALRVYFGAPGGGAVSFFDALTKSFLGQIL